MYDPILCMNVPDSVKTKDETFIIEAKKEGKVYKAIVNGNEQELRKYYSHKGFTDIVLKQTKGKDSKTIDTAIRSCDIDFDKDSYFILNYGKHSETILSEGAAMNKFKKVKEQFGNAELIVIKNGKVSRKYN